METFDITKYLDMALRRKWWIIISFLLTILGGLTFILITPPIYEAETLILIQAQKVPENLVQPIVSGDVDTRLKTIMQQVTSRTNLEEIIQKYKLYANLGSDLSIDRKVEKMREKIKIDISREGKSRNSTITAFTVTFRDEDPKTVMEVTNTLASNFISENLRARESQALGTSGFLADELENVIRSLKEKEEHLKQYREKFMGGLPEQLDTNLRILERLQAQQDQVNSNLRDAANRKLSIEKTIEEARKAGANRGSSTPDQGEDAKDLVSLKNKLAAMEAKYTQKHPDVIRLKKMIEKLEAEEPHKVSDSTERNAEPPFVDKTVIRQLKDVNLEVETLKDETNKLKSQIKWYQTKVEETPKREQELLSLQRDYNNLQELHKSLLNRKLEAEIAVSMEKKQKGEQFRVIDPAKIPTFPVEPDLRKIILMTLFLGLGLGVGLAYLLETMDSSFKTPDEAEKGLDIPVLISIPIRYTDNEIRSMKKKQIIAFASVGMGFLLSAIGLILGVKGLGTTINYVKNIFDKM
jgi:polysaccharide chain length determinant protein (PEP-CTERM system associated)